LSIIYLTTQVRLVRFGSMYYVKDTLG